MDLTRRRVFSPAHFPAGETTEPFQLLMMVSAPVHAVLLLFPITETLEARRKGEDAAMEGGKAYPIDKSVWWIKQRVHLQFFRMRATGANRDSPDFERLRYNRSAARDSECVVCTQSNVHAIFSRPLNQSNLVFKAGSTLAKFCEECRGNDLAFYQISSANII
jgi:hypothetical protein